MKETRKGIGQSRDGRGGYLSGQDSCSGLCIVVACENDFIAEHHCPQQCMNRRYGYRAIVGVGLRWISHGNGWNQWHIDG